MNSNADSNAILEIQRILPQHQSALTLLNTRLQNPQIVSINWLDLACGKGQIMSQLSENLSNENRRKVKYFGYEINVDYARMASKIASNLNLLEYSFSHGDLSNFTLNIPNGIEFEFITCTNVAHEINPNSFAIIIIDSLMKLSDNGQLFIYDMETLNQLELGALPWRGEEIAEIINLIFSNLGICFKVHPSIWSHKTCKGWSIVIDRQYLNVSNEIINCRKQDLLPIIEEKISEILEKRFLECHKVLNTFRLYGIETASDEQEKVAALYEFWAIYRAKEVRK